ncbi:hypothetical protein Tco_1000595, partial [Tanacetum coccineum]
KLDDFVNELIDSRKVWYENGKLKSPCVASQIAIINKKDTLWVKWEIEKQSNDSTLWKNLLDLREDIRKHVQYKVGDGFSVSMWHDSWSMLPNSTTLAECIEDQKWKWPEQWLSEHPNLNQYPVPVLNIGTKDKLMWCSNEGSMKIFSSSQVWNDIRILNDKMLWWKVIWFPQKRKRSVVFS